MRLVEIDGKELAGKLAQWPDSEDAVTVQVVFFSDRSHNDTINNLNVFLDYIQYCN